MEITSLAIFIIAGIFLGLPTGPSRFFVVDAYLNVGAKSALKVYAGLIGALAIYTGLAIIASGFLSRNDRIEDISYLAGSSLLLAWGVFIIIKAKKEGGSSIKIGIGSYIVKGFLTGLSSPITPFIYLTLIQLLKYLSGGTSLWNTLLHLFVAESFSCLTIFSIAYLANRRHLDVDQNWKIAKVVMGIFLIALGTAGLIQLVEYRDGLQIEKKQNLLQEQMKS